MDFIERVRNKPQSFKTHYAFAAALVVTLVIAIGWLTTLPGRLALIENKSDSTQEETEPGHEAPTAVLETLKDQFANLAESVEDTERAAEATSSEIDFFNQDESLEANQVEIAVARDDGSAVLAPTPRAAATSSVSTVDNQLNAQVAIGATTTTEASTPSLEPRIILIATTSAQQTE